MDRRLLIIRLILASCLYYAACWWFGAPWWAWLVPVAILTPVLRRTCTTGACIDNDSPETVQLVVSGVTEGSGGCSDCVAKINGTFILTFEPDFLLSPCDYKSAPFEYCGDSLVWVFSWVQRDDGGGAGLPLWLIQEVGSPRGIMTDTTVGSAPIDCTSAASGFACVSLCNGAINDLHCNLTSISATVTPIP